MRYYLPETKNAEVLESKAIQSGENRVIWLSFVRKHIKKWLAKPAPIALNRHPIYAIALTEK